MPNRSATSWVNAVSNPCPTDIDPERRVSVPSSAKRRVDRSLAGRRNGPPATSMQLHRPMPRSFPRAFASARRASNPSSSARPAAVVMLPSNSPQSYRKVSAVWYGIFSGGIRLRRRSSYGVMPSSRAATSISRSIV